VVYAAVIYFVLEWYLRKSVRESRERKE
jgi:hypothetical protein